MYPALILSVTWTHLLTHYILAGGTGVLLNYKSDYVMTTILSIIEPNIIRYPRIREHVYTCTISLDLAVIMCVDL